jgi:hypothetical protein
MFSQALKDVRNPHGRGATERFGTRSRHSRRPRGPCPARARPRSAAVNALAHTPWGPAARRLSAPVSTRTPVGGDLVPRVTVNPAARNDPVVTRRSLPVPRMGTSTEVTSSPLAGSVAGDVMVPVCCQPANNAVGVKRTTPGNWSRNPWARPSRTRDRSIRASDRTRSRREARPPR